MRVFLFVHFAVFLFLSPVFAEINIAVVSESIVQVRVYKNHKILAEGSGFVVNEEGYVLTNAHLLADAEGLTVWSRKTGAEIVSQQIFAKKAAADSLKAVAKAAADSVGAKVELPPKQCCCRIGREVISSCKNGCLWPEYKFCMDRIWNSATASKTGQVQ